VSQNLKELKVYLRLIARALEKKNGEKFIGATFAFFAFFLGEQLQFLP
jgi:hypothetical protein